MSRRILSLIISVGNTLSHPVRMYEKIKRTEIWVLQILKNLIKQKNDKKKGKIHIDKEFSSDNQTSKHFPIE